MKNLVFLVSVLLFLSSCQTSSSVDNQSVSVFCAASLRDVVSDITSDFETKTETRVKLNLASSGTLARQIENGARADIFISANKNWLDYLIQKESVEEGTAKRIAGNALVLVAPLNSKLEAFSFSDEMNLPQLFEGRLSIGDPAHVPAGAYALEILDNLGCKKELESRFLPAKDVRSALMVVELGEVEAGIVYKTDALKSEKIKILTVFPDSLHQSVDYYIALIKGNKNEHSLQLYNYLVSENALPVWEKYGFKQ